MDIESKQEEWSNNTIAVQFAKNKTHGSNQTDSVQRIKHGQGFRDAREHQIIPKKLQKKDIPHDRSRSWNYIQVMRQHFNMRRRQLNSRIVMSSLRLRSIITVRHCTPVRAASQMHKAKGNGHKYAQSHHHPQHQQIWKDWKAQKKESASWLQPWLQAFQSLHNFARRSYKWWGTRLAFNHLADKHWKENCLQIRTLHKTYMVSRSVKIHRKTDASVEEEVVEEHAVQNLTLHIKILPTTWPPKKKIS